MIAHYARMAVTRSFLPAHVRRAKFHPKMVEVTRSEPFFPIYYVHGHPLRIVRETNYASAFAFKYSARPGTSAAEAEQIDEDVKSDRLQRLQALLSRQQAAFQRACVGRTLPVLIEKSGRMPGQMVGRSPYLQAVHLDADPGLKGRIVDVTIEAAKPNSLAGRLIG